MTTHLDLAERALRDARVHDTQLAQTHALIHIGKCLDRLLDGYGASLRNAPSVEAHPSHVHNVEVRIRDVRLGQENLERLQRLNDLASRGYTRTAGR